MEKTVDEIWDILEGGEYFTRQELELVTYLDGYNVETLNAIIYIRYGCRNIEQLTEEYE